MSKPALWTEFGTCLHCKQDFDMDSCLPISLDCGHTFCKECLKRLNREQKLCPLDSKDKITQAMINFPINIALLAAAIGAQVERDKFLEDSVVQLYSTVPEQQAFLECAHILEKLSKHLKCSKSGANNTSSQFTKEMSSCAYINTSGTVTLSRPMQKKLLSLITCQLATCAGIERAGRCVRSLGERCITELILQHQHPHLLSGNLWGAVRSRGCQFLGPAMQEEVIRLILMALEDGSALSRKVLVLFVVQRLQEKYPQASKTAIGHVVQLLYRASCFKVMKRENESSLMQLKEEYCKYEHLRYEHDKQIVQIAHEAGLRIAPDQWSSLLYGDMYHKSKMQSIIDRLQTPQSFRQSISEFLIALGRTNDPSNISSLEKPLLQICAITDAGTSDIAQVLECLQAMDTVVDALTIFVRDHCQDRLNFGTLAHTKYKTSMCRDIKTRGACPRGPTCTFAHNDEEDMDKNDDILLEEVVPKIEPPELPVSLKPRAVVSPTARIQTPSDIQWQSRPPSLHTHPGYYQHSPANEMSPAELVISPPNMPAAGFYHQLPVAPGNMPRLAAHQPLPVLPHPPLSPSGYMSMGAGAADIALVPTHPYQPYYSQQPANYYNLYECHQQYPQPNSPRSYIQTQQLPDDQYHEQGIQLPDHVYVTADYQPAVRRAPADYRGEFQRVPTEHTTAYQRALAEAYRRPLGEADHRPPTEAHRRPPTEAHHRPPAETYRQRPGEAHPRLPTEAHHRPHADVHHRPHADVHHRPPTEAQHRPPAEGHHRPPAEAHYRQPAGAHHRQPAEECHRPPAEAHHRPPAEAHHRPPAETNHRSSNGAHLRTFAEMHQQAPAEHGDLERQASHDLDIPSSIQVAHPTAVTFTGSPSTVVPVDDVMGADSENLYEYHSHATDSSNHNLVTLKRRREELLDKIQSHQQPAEKDDTVKTEISRARIEDLARSLAVSMNVGAQEDDLHATFVNSMLSAANLAPLSDRMSPAEADNQEMEKLSKWWKLSSAGRQSDEFSYKQGTLYNSLSRVGGGAHQPQLSSTAHENHPVWTSLSGLTSVVEWTGLRRSLSERESVAESSDFSPKLTRSVSHSAPESNEPIIPWTDRPLISMFGPISRGAKVELARAEARLVTQPPISAKLETDVKDKLPIQVSASNTLTMTAVTPVKRPIPSPSLAHSKFTARPDNHHGFTLTAADMEGSSSIAESEQLRQELKILNYKIGKAEAQAASEELTDLERSIRRLETGGKTSSATS